MASAKEEHAERRKKLAEKIDKEIERYSKELRKANEHIHYHSSRWMASPESAGETYFGSSHCRHLQERMQQRYHLRVWKRAAAKLEKRIRELQKRRSRLSDSPLCANRERLMAQSLKEKAAVKLKSEGGMAQSKPADMLKRLYKEIDG